MYNFLDHKLKPKVNANCPSTDGYEVENLISETFHSKGFIAYSAIRPPVNIIFEFICPIRIHCIIIWTSVGTQKSTGLELEAKNCNTDFTSICKAFTDTPGIVLYNKEHSLKQPSNIPNNFLTRHCRSNQSLLLNNTEKIRLKILRTSNSVPCIGKIEIWGSISRTCSDITKQTIQKLINGRNYSSVENCASVCSSIETNESVRQRTNDNSSLNIPEEFIDPISCEIMCLPMTLPSGKTIDQSTLEKYKKSQAIWGRTPGDPFTGQEFTSVRKPILNTALKNRIDQFLLANAHVENTFHIHRTLGRKIKTNESTNNLIREETNEITKSNETSVTDNLDDLINNAIKRYKITRFTENKSESSTRTENCGFCKVENNLYTIMCSHFICRSCLTNITEYRCKICNVTFAKSNVKKHHS